MRPRPTFTPREVQVVDWMRRVGRVWRPEHDQRVVELVRRDAHTRSTIRVRAATLDTLLARGVLVEVAGTPDAWKRGVPGSLRRGRGWRITAAPEQDVAIGMPELGRVTAVVAYAAHDRIVFDCPCGGVVFTVHVYGVRTGNKLMRATVYANGVWWLSDDFAGGDDANWLAIVAVEAVRRVVITNDAASAMVRLSAPGGPSGAF